MGGSVWELKIDPKRLREEIKNDIEKKKETNNPVTYPTHSDHLPR